MSNARPGWTAVPHALRDFCRVELEPGQRWLLLELVAGAQWEPGDCIVRGKSVRLDTGEVLIGQRPFAEANGVDRGQVRRLLAKLKKLGVISTREAGPPPDPGEHESPGPGIHESDDPGSRASHSPRSDPPPTIVRIEKWRGIIWPLDAGGPPPGPGVEQSPGPGAEHRPGPPLPPESTHLPAHNPARSNTKHSTQRTTTTTKDLPAAPALPGLETSASALQVRPTSGNKKAGPSPEEQTCRAELSQEFERQFGLLSAGEPYSWSAADRKAIATICAAAENEPAKAKALLLEFVRRMPSEPFYAGNFSPRFIAGKVNQLRLPAAPPRPTRAAPYMPLTGTKERFANYDDGDPLGLNLKPRQEAPRG